MSLATSVEPEGGYEWSLFLDTKDTLLKYQCFKCKKLARDIIELTCHDDDHSIKAEQLTYCDSCIKSSNKCPINNHLNPTTISMRGFKREISNLDVVCPNSNINKFMEGAMHNETEGRFDDDDIKKDDKDSCSDSDGRCKWKGKLYELDTHLLKECKSIPVNCEYFDLGCNKKISKTEQKSHKKEYVTQHLDLVINNNKLLNNKIDKLNNKINEFESKFNELNEIIKDLQEKVENNSNNNNNNRNDEIKEERLNNEIERINDNRSVWIASWSKDFKSKDIVLVSDNVCHCTTSERRSIRSEYPLPLNCVTKWNIMWHDRPKNSSDQYYFVGVCSNDLENDYESLAYWDCFKNCYGMDSSPYREYKKIKTNYNSPFKMSAANNIITQLEYNPFKGHLIFRRLNNNNNNTSNNNNNNNNSDSDDDESNNTSNNDLPSAHIIELLNEDKKIEYYPCISFHCGGKHTKCQITKVD